MSTPIEQNTTELQAILDMVNNLLAAGSGGGGNNPLAAIAMGEKYDITAEDLAGVTTIVGHVFNGWSRIREVYLPDSLLEIEECAFESCRIMHIDFGNSIENIGSYAFINAFYADEEMPLHIEIPSSVKTINWEAFAELPDNSTVIFKGTPDYIAPSAFNRGVGSLIIKVPWSEGEVANAPWVEGTSITPNIIYNYTED